MSNPIEEITRKAQELAELIAALPDVDRQIEALNAARQTLHEVSPLKHHPVDCVLWVKSEDVEGNEYNPNAVAPPEMRLLIRSIEEDGYTMPIVSFPLGKIVAASIKEGMSIKQIANHLGATPEKIQQFSKNENAREVVDGFHRRKAERTSSKIHESTLGYVPLSTIRPEKQKTSDRMASTIRHNRARGTHSVDLMVNIVAELTEAGMGNDWIMKHTGMDADELLRLKQISGLAALFKNGTYSKAWE